MKKKTSPFAVAFIAYAVTSIVVGIILAIIIQDAEIVGWITNLAGISASIVAAIQQYNKNEHESMYEWHY